MNLVTIYINMKETVEYYEIRPAQITNGLHPNYLEWHMCLKPSDLFCGMMPEKFFKIITGNNRLSYKESYMGPMFKTKEDCILACRLLSIYLYKRDYL